METSAGSEVRGSTGKLLQPEVDAGFRIPAYCSQVVRRFFAEYTNNEPRFL